MGKQSAADGGMGATGVATPAKGPAQFAAELGKGVAMGLHALGPFKSPSMAQGGGFESDSKQGYGEEDIAALMGFSHVKKGSELQDIWTYFHTMRSKNIDICRQQLMAQMNRWVHERHIPIDSSVYLEGTTIKAIMELKFNPGEGVAHLSLADKGLSIMACRSQTSTETEQIRESEEALSATENTRQLDKLLRLFKGVTRAPADNFWELKINIAKFMSLVRVLFGSECDYYKGLRNVYATLGLKEVMAQKSRLTAENCCRITWVILNDGPAHFNDVKTTLNFQGPEVLGPLECPTANKLTRHDTDRDKRKPTTSATGAEVSTSPHMTEDQKFTINGELLHGGQRKNNTLVHFACDHNKAGKPVGEPHTGGLGGLQPPWLETTGGAVYGANKKQMQKESKQHRRRLKGAQDAGSQWETHQVKVTSTSAPQIQPLQVYRNSMCPTGRALAHPAAGLLTEWAILGCPTHTGKPWTRDEIWEAVARGPHQSA